MERRLPLNHIKRPCKIKINKGNAVKWNKFFFMAMKYSELDLKKELNVGLNNFHSPLLGTGFLPSLNNILLTLVAIGIRSSRLIC